MTGSLHERQPPAFTATGLVYRTLTGFPHHRACLSAVLTGDTMQLIQFFIDRLGFCAPFPPVMWFFE